MPFFAQQENFWSAHRMQKNSLPINQFVRQFNQMWALANLQICRLNLFDVTPPLLWYICLWNLRYRGLHIVIRNDKCDKTSTNRFAYVEFRIFQANTHSSSWSEGWYWSSFVQLSWLKEWIQLQQIVTSSWSVIYKTIYWQPIYWPQAF